MGFLLEKCHFKRLDKSVIETCKPFSCEHPDLDDFFANDVLNYSKELLGKSYCFCLDEQPDIIVCAFTISNDSIKTDTLPPSRKAKIRKPIPHQKHFRSYPAVLIGRLGVNKAFKNTGIGCELMDFIKGWFIDENNKTGCRFIVVDSYNEKAPLKYYQKNNFDFIFSSEIQECQYTGHKNSVLNTRLMYFDLIRLSNQ